MAGVSKDVFLNLITENNPIGIPYLNIKNNNDIKYYDPRIITRIKSSQGMAAGNTLEEALCQGISEIMEIYATSRFYAEPQEKYYYFTKEDIEDETLYKIADNIEKANNQSLIFLDLSYNFNVPVIASLLINHINYNVVMNFGCFPIFNIALERCMTELYQGIKSHLKKFFYPIRPYREKSIGEIWLISPGSVGRNGIINEEIFSHLTKTSNRNNCFCSEINNLTNQDILNKIIELGEKNNFNYYYHNNSLTKEMYALDIICDEMDMGYGWTEFFTNYPEEDKALSVMLGILRKEFLNDCFNREVQLDKYNILAENINLTASMIPLLIQGWPGLYYGQGEHNFDILLNLFIKDNIIEDNLLQQIKKSFYYSKFNYFNIIRAYKDSNLYSDQEIFNFLKILNPEAQLEDIEQCYNKNYVFTKAFLDPFLKENEIIFPLLINNLIPDNL